MSKASINSAVVVSNYLSKGIMFREHDSVSQGYKHFLCNMLLMMKTPFWNFLGYTSVGLQQYSPCIETASYSMLISMSSVRLEYLFLSLIQNQSYPTIGGQSARLSWCQATIRAGDKFFFLLEMFFFCIFVAPSLTRGRVYNLLLLQSLADAVPLGPESHGTQDHILLSQFLIILQLWGPGSEILESYDSIPLNCSIKSAPLVRQIILSLI
jgi:hypothetical protein